MQKEKYQMFHRIYDDARDNIYGKIIGDVRFIGEVTLLQTTIPYSHLMEKFPSKYLVVNNDITNKLDNNKFISVDIFKGNKTINMFINVDKIDSAEVLNLVEFKVELNHNYDCLSGNHYMGEIVTIQCLIRK